MKIDVTTLEDLKEHCINNLRAVNSDMAQLQVDRASALSAYLCKPYGDEIEGRSQFVTSDLADTVDSLMPSLMKTFYGSATVVSVNPVGPEDVKAAQLLEQKINYDFTCGMNGYQILDTWFRDALYQKIGVVKYWWQEDTEYKSKEWDDLTEPEYLNLLQQADAGKILIDSEEVETASEAEVDAFGSMVKPPEVRYSVKGRKVTKISKPMVVNVPPEELIFNLRSKNLTDCEFIAHKKRVHKTYLSKYKIKNEEITSEIDTFESNQLYIERFADLGGVTFIRDADNPDFVFIYECYVNNYDKTGRKVPYKIVILGNRVIDCEENKYGRPPFCVLSSIPVPHRLVGRDYADLVMPIQRLSTYFTRYIVDNVAYQNNGMRIVNPFRVNMDDVIAENSPGAIWRTKYDIDPSRVVTPITPTPLAPEVYNMREALDDMRQERTGITKYQQGTDSKSLNRTASGIAQIMGAAQMRVEQLIRGMAETGVRDLFQGLADMNLDFLDSEVNIRINQEWISVSPDQIDGKFDIMVDVSSSFGASEIKSQQMLTALNTYQMLKQGGTPVPSKYEYNVLREWWTVQGYKNVDSYAPSAESIIPDMSEQQQAMAQLQQQAMALQPPPPQEPQTGTPQ